MTKPKHTGTATISPCGTYRYLLTRTWQTGHNTVTWIMLNPSTADANLDDNTIRRCINYAHRWGYAGIKVVNLFAYRSTNPHNLHTTPDPIGPDNNHYITQACNDTGLIIAAWGTHGTYLNRDQQVINLINPHQPHCLGTAKHGTPLHPLRLPNNRQPTPYHHQQLTQPNITITNKNEVKAYLTKHKDLTTIIEPISTNLRQKYGHLAHLTLELYHDPEIKDTWLVLYLRLPTYDTNTINAIQEATAPHLNTIEHSTGQFLVTTDHRKINI